MWRAVWLLAAAGSTLHGTRCGAAGPLADWISGVTQAPVQIGGPQSISAYYGGTVIAAQPVNDPAAQQPPSLPMPSSGSPMQGGVVLPPGSVAAPSTVMPPGNVMPPSTTGWGYPSSTCATGQCGAPMTAPPTAGAWPPAAAVPQPSAPQATSVGRRSLFGNYNSVNNRTPVTYYRPVVSIDPVTNQTFTSLQPCTSYEMQLQRQYRLLGRPSIHGSGLPPAVAMPQARGGVVPGVAYRPVVPGTAVVAGIPSQTSYYGAAAGQIPQRLPYAGTALTSSPGLPTAVPTPWGSPVSGAIAPPAMLPPSPVYLPVGSGQMPGGVVPASGFYQSPTASHIPAQAMGGYGGSAAGPWGMAAPAAVPQPVLGGQSYPAPLSPAVSASAVPVAGYPPPVYPGNSSPLSGYAADPYAIPSSAPPVGSAGSPSVWPPADRQRERSAGDPESNQPPSLPPSAGSDGLDYRSIPGDQASPVPASGQLGRARWGDDWRSAVDGGDFSLQPILPDGSDGGWLAAGQADWSRSLGADVSSLEKSPGEGRAVGAAASEHTWPASDSPRLDRPEQPIPLGGEESMPRWSPGLLQTQDRTAAGGVMTAASVATTSRPPLPAAAERSRAAGGDGRFADTDRLLDNLQLRSSPSR